MGTPTFSSSLWGGIPGNSKDFRNSTGYWTDGLVNAFVTFKVARNHVDQLGVNLVYHVIFRCKYGTLT